MILGQSSAVGRLGRMLAAGRLPHALLFAGPAGAGKLTQARLVAMALSCAAPRGAEPCGGCESCHKISTGVHPDFAVLRPQGAGQVIAIGEIRELAAKLAYRPHEGAARVVVLDDADRLTVEAANAFLKTLEEPPPRTHFILVTPAPDRLPATVMSRCQRVLFLPLSPAVLTEILIAAGVPADRAQAVAPLAGGSAARALAMAVEKSDEVEQRRARVTQLTAAARGGSIKAAVDAASALAAQKEEIGPTLELLGLWYRDAAALAAGAPPEVLAHASDLDGLRAEGHDPAALARSAGAVLEARKALLGYANPQLTLERMLLTVGRELAA